MTWTPDAPSTEDVLLVVLASPVPPLPPQEQTLGATTVAWWEMDPGEVYIHAEGGTPDDRHYATTLVGLQLEAHSYRRAQFDMDTMDTVHTSGSQPLTDLAAAHPNVQWNPYEAEDHVSTGGMIKVAPELRGQGYGTAAMQGLVAHADQVGKPIVVTPDGSFGTSKSDLMQWYKGLGFKKRNGDYELPRGTMVRHPRRMA